MRAFLAIALLFATPAALAESEPTLQYGSAVQTDHTDAWRAHLTQRRTVQLQRLRNYADAGVFPVNDESSGLLNIFVDEQGRRCAMADLIWQDGEQALVRRTSHTDNALLLGEVTDGPLMAWILESGLTQSEVAFVQEPDFFISQELPPGDQLQRLTREQDRHSSHFTAAADNIEMYTDASIEAALEALGERVAGPPPTEAVASARWGWLR